jgi:peptidoglycan L-alanyl-D-glutamate endopeptidase CwlK
VNEADGQGTPVPTIHRVASGETLILIAKRNGVTLEALLASNPQITNANRIAVGQSVTIPAGGVVIPSTAGAPAVAVAGVALGTVPPVGASPVSPIGSVAFAAMDKRGKTTGLHPLFRERLAMLADILAQHGMKALITDGMRTIDEQDELFKKGRRGIPGEAIVTKARGGESNHNYGLAVDMYPVLPAASGRDQVFTDIPDHASVEFARAFRRIQNAIGEEAEGIGLFWGARFSGIADTPHVQLLAEHELSAKACLKIFRDHGNNLQTVWDEASRHVRPIGV